MTKYIVYEKKECSCLYAKECGDWYEDECVICEDKGHNLYEVSLACAIKDLLRTDGQLRFMINSRVLRASDNEYSNS